MVNVMDIDIWFTVIVVNPKIVQFAQATDCCDDFFD